MRMPRRVPLPRRVIPGSGIPDDVRAAVVTRDQSRCQRCGDWCANIPSALHHRLPRGRGGDASPANLVLLCADCHARVESDRAQAYADGWLVRTGCDPAETPVLTFVRWRYLTADCRSLTPTERAREDA